MLTLDRIASEFGRYRADPTQPQWLSRSAPGYPLSKAELKQRILAYLEDLNRDPVVHTWRYKLAQPA